MNGAWARKAASAAIGHGNKVKDGATLKIFAAQWKAMTQENILSKAKLEHIMGYAWGIGNRSVREWNKKAKELALKEAAALRIREITIKKKEADAPSTPDRAATDRKLEKIPELIEAMTPGRRSVTKSILRAMSPASKNRTGVRHAASSPSPSSFRRITSSVKKMWKKKPIYEDESVANQNEEVIPPVKPTEFSSSSESENHQLPAVNPPKLLQPVNAPPAVNPPKLLRPVTAPPEHELYHPEASSHSNQAPMLTKYDKRDQRNWERKHSVPLYEPAQKILSNKFEDNQEYAEKEKWEALDQMITFARNNIVRHCGISKDAATVNYLETKLAKLKDVLAEIMDIRDFKVPRLVLKNSEGLYPECLHDSMARLFLSQQKQVIAKSANGGTYAPGLDQ